MLQFRDCEVCTRNFGVRGRSFCRHRKRLLRPPPILALPDVNDKGRYRQQRASNVKSSFDVQGQERNGLSRVSRQAIASDLEKLCKSSKCLLKRDRHLPAAIEGKHNSRICDKATQFATTVKDDVEIKHDSFPWRSDGDVEGTCAVGFESVRTRA